MTTEFEKRVRQTGLRLYELAEGEKPSLFKKDYWTGKVMDWSMKNEAFKQEMFRFVDVFPCLTRPESVAKHIQEYFCQPGQDFPKSMQWGLKLVKPDSIAAKLAAKSITKNINAMGKQFITGADLKEAAPIMKKIRKQGVAWTVKILKEAVTSTKDEELFLQAQTELLEELHERQQDWPALGKQSGDWDWGFTPKANISLMASCLFSQYLTKAAAFDYCVDRAKERLRPIYRKAMDVGAYVMMDMEHLPAREFTMELFKSINEEPEFRDYPHKGIAYQAYLRDAEPMLKTFLEWSRQTKQDFGIRLVKGAFWDEEVVLANQYNYAVPVFTNKHETDASFEACTRLILENHTHTMLKCGSHNVRSVAYAIETAKDLNVPEDRLEFQMLHGMAENLRMAWVKAGLHLRLYAPVGEIIPGMAYLVRRLLENTSNESFLRQSFAEGVAREQLLRNPVELAQDTSASSEPSEELSPYGEKGPFLNEPPLEWTAENRRLFAASLQDVRERFPVEIPLRVGSREVATPHALSSTNPNDPKEIVGKACIAGLEELETAIAAAQEAGVAWERTAPEKRSEIIFKAAEVVRKKRHELAALLVIESGKNWPESQLDINEAIDFLEYYGREMIRLSKPRTTARIPGESSRMVYSPMGVGAVLASWQSALPASIGMCSAAIVTGNTVVYQSASQTPAIGEAVYEIFNEAGLPQGVLNFLPGLESETVDRLVSHSQVAFTVFSGHRDTGLRIAGLAAKTKPGNTGIKKVIAEMGGNNAIIVDADADLDEAVGHIIQSVFGYQGQKSSTCSRLIVLEENYDKFLDRFKNSVQTLAIGLSEDPKTDVGAVIDEAIEAKMKSFIEKGQKEGQVLIQHAAGNPTGHFVPPTVFVNIPPDSELMQEEVPGPVVCITSVKDFDDALDVANHTAYALSGGVFSRSPANIERAFRDFQVGNLFINRSITAALMQRHPFGGFKMSGIGAKTMGPDYLAQFMHVRTIVENTFRSGFAPMDN